MILKNEYTNDDWFKAIYKQDNSSLFNDLPLVDHDSNIPKATHPYTNTYTAMIATKEYNSDFCIWKKIKEW